MDKAKHCYSALLMLLKQVNISPYVFLPSIFLAALSSIAKLVELRFMIAFISGIVSRDFSHTAPVKILSKTPFIPNPPTYISLLLVVVSAFFIFAVFSSSLEYLSNLSVQKRMRITESKLRFAVFKRFLLLGKDYYDTNNITKLQGIIIRHTHNVSELIRNLHRSTGSLFMVIACLTILFVISWKLALITTMIFGIITAFGFCKEFNGEIDTAKQIVSQRNLDKNIFHVISCAPLIQTHSQEKYECEKFNSINDEELDIAYKIMSQQERSREFLNILSLIGLIFVALLIGLMPVSNLNISTGRMVSFLLILRIMSPNLRTISSLGAHLHQGIRPIQIISDLLGKKMDEFLIPDGKTELRKFENAIRFDKVSYKYRRRPPALRKVSLYVPKGSLTAIVGGSGSGKSTIAHLLLRLYDTKKGEIFIDGTDIRDLTLNSLRKMIGLVSQEIYLFNETVRYNLLYGTNSTEEIALSTMLNKMELEDLMEYLPEGIDTVIGDRGATLSGGEKQKLSLARVILRDTPILVLDEPSSALDSKTEQVIQECIMNKSNDQTIIVISHRLSTIKNADNIIVLEEGRVKEQGTFIELVNRRGVLYDYYLRQRLDGDDKEKLFSMERVREEVVV
ncbi:ABC transporter ATP-binding protein/permease [Patescibacteria group bacterium]|nr:ABC transporter ATP-binding protein/permease [Patescibacteria group bacterium]MBU1911649.1 ABC transporter ATP-binding protein/permease [Patescibacteria group bacterium]